MPEAFDSFLAAENAAGEYAKAQEKPGHKFFASFIQGEEKAPSDEDIASNDLINRARAIHASDDINIDHDAKVSEADEGSWVQGWLWVPGGEG